MKNIYLDSCIWINYVWQTQFSDKPKRKNPATKLIEKLANSEHYQLTLTPYLISEISTHFRDNYILQKVMRDGFSYRDFNREKKNYELDKEEIEKINQIIIYIGGLESVNVLLPEDIKKEALEEILDLETTYYFDFYDAIHFQTAKDKKCEYFITTDGPLRTSAARFNKANKAKLECMPPSTLLRKLNR